jgi:hypothetical protein
VSDYKRRKGMSVLLLHPPNAAPALLLAASRTHNFHQLLADVPSRPTNHAPDGGGGAQPIGVELELTNLPGPLEQDVKETDRQVSAIVEEYEGSIQARVLTNFAHLGFFVKVNPRKFSPLLKLKNLTAI